MKKILHFCLAALISLFFIDLFIHFSGVQSRSPNVVDDKLGILKRPLSSHVKFSEGFYLGSYNKHGYLGPGYSKKKPSAIKKRIALIGDSFVEGIQLFDRAHFRKLIEDELKKRSKEDFEVLNFGRSGFDLSDMYLYYNQFIKPHEPDINLFFLSGADLNTKSSMSYPGLMYKDSSLQADYSFREKSTFPVYQASIKGGQYSSLFYLATFKLFFAKKEQLLKALFGKFYSFSGKKNNHNHKITAKEESLLLARKTLEELNKSKEAMGVIVWDNSTEKDKQFLLSQDFDIKIDLTTAIPASSIPKEGLNYWKVKGRSGHWNHRGHEEVAKAIANAILLHLRREGK